ncbi:MAG: hypothetical protein HYV09_01335 [Deltaproteobacteria bacterium]|nr:hypothetical protein [Deltaproteobacteria bacterium]
MDFSRRREDACVIAIGEHPAARPTHHRVDAAREANAESLHPTRQDATVVRLDDHVHVVALHREVHDPQEAARALGRERVLDAAVATLAA